ARGGDVVVSYAFDREDLGSAVYRPRAHVPLLRDPDDARYRHAGVSTGQPDGEATPAAGDLMTFAHIAAEALEVLEDGRTVGRDLLAIIKADVDRLGRIFAEGLRGDRSPARIAQLSRLIEAYFTERLPWLLAQTPEFRAIYTVYAGGDDLLLVSPWRAAMPFAVALREDFGTFSGGNPDITLSAGIAFVHPKHPLASAVETAEEALERAKAAGRNRLGLFDRVLSWDSARATLELAEALNAVVREGLLPPTVLHRMRWFAARRAMAEQGDEQAADWNPKWRYHESRLLDGTEARFRDRLAATLRDALPPPGQAQPADAELAITIALWRNR
ncbi:MAG: hypothetical protein NZM07_11105, partial [Elioraea sp.]|nr:hypothetical protein [Elioraea sp.]